MTAGRGHPLHMGAVVRTLADPSTRRTVDGIGWTTGPLHPVVTVQGLPHAITVDALLPADDAAALDAWDAMAQSGKL